MLPEESDPIEAAANTPATLPESTGYPQVTAAEPTIETTVTAELTGDVQITARQDVIATVFQRVYENGDQRFGLITAPLVQLMENRDVYRDPVATLEDSRIVELAIDRAVGTIGEWSETDTVSLLGAETTTRTTTATVDGEERDIVRVRVRAGEDSVTAIATGENADPPFKDVEREA